MSASRMLLASHSLPTIDINCTITNIYIFFRLFLILIILLSYENKREIIFIVGILLNSERCFDLKFKKVSEQMTQ